MSKKWYFWSEISWYVFTIVLKGEIWKGCESFIDALRVWYMQKYLF